MTVPTTAILEHLGLTQQAPTLAFLNQILAAWSARIPWESASRIVRHQSPGTPETYARFPETFFESALQHGTGGTCFESNLSLRSLLQSLGFECTLHFCDMESETVNPHCALIVQIEGEPYIADVGYPISTALRLDIRKNTSVKTPVYHFTAIPHARNRWEVRRKVGIFEGSSFVIKADPIDEATFRTRLVQDHEPRGLFLTEVIVSRTNSEHMLRYSEDKGLVKRTQEGEESVYLSQEEEADLPATLARLFQYDEAILRKAFSAQRR